MTDYQHDKTVADHRAWINSLGPVGLFVSPTVLAEAQVVLPAPDPEQQRRFNEFVVKRGTVAGAVPAADDDSAAEAADEPCIADTPKFLGGFLGWPADLVHGLDAARPIPESLRVPLPELGIELVPTLALADPKPADPSRPWQMLVQSVPVGTDLDEKQEGDWDASASQRFERLLRDTRTPLGLLTDGRMLRVIHAPEKESPGSLTFPVSFMAEVAGRKVLAGLHLLLSHYRLASAPTAARLLTLCVRSRDFQATVSTRLAAQVIDAAFELVRGLQAAHEHSHGTLLADVLARRPDEVYEGMLTVLMRLVFTLYAEDRGLFPTTGLYLQDYGLHGLFERLRADAARNPDTMNERFGAWWRLFTLFQMIHGGSKHPQLPLPARAGYLFDPDRFPWLEGRPTSRDPIDAKTIPAVPDGTIHRVLEKLLVLDGERLSYRTLDVEQIGSVYEVMMGFGIGLADGPSIAIKPKKKLGAPVPVNLDALLAQPADKRAKWLDDKTDHKLTPKQSAPLKAAKTTDDLLAALDAARKIARTATPQPVTKGAMLLVPSDERRRSGSNYTPRKLTEPIVRKTFEPIFAALGPKPTPEEILDLKVCDPAMGSGAFLVEACRQLAERLVVAWDRHHSTPPVPPDETKTLLAQRLVAQKCLYGVDKNPMAADLAKLSLWLATLAKDHPFTFLDHSLRAGDSLVGLSRKQIASLHWEPQAQLPLVADRLAKAIARAGASRREILDAGDFLTPELKAQKLAIADDALSQARLIGDCVIAAFFSADKAAKRQVMLDRLALVVGPFVKGDGDYARQRGILSDFANWLRGQPRDPAVASGSEALAAAAPISHPLVPFHWEIEFPEVFGERGGNPGFDAIVGNPPFAGVTTLSESTHKNYTAFLRTAWTETGGKCDLVAFFFRRSFDMLRQRGCFGLIATNTISQGDTRASGLIPLVRQGADIYCATKRRQWPGEAAVVVSEIHIHRGPFPGQRILNRNPVPTITAFLFTQGGSEMPLSIATPIPTVTKGVVPYSVGFVVDDDTNGCIPSAAIEAVLTREPASAARVKPYMGGEDINNIPTLQPTKRIVHLDDLDLTDRPHFPGLFDLIEQYVKPERDALTDQSGAATLKQYWWRYQYSAHDLFSCIKSNRLTHVFAVARVSPHLAVGRLPHEIVFNEKLVVFPREDWKVFSALQSQLHDGWVRLLTSTLEDRLNYSPTDCFETFPFPENFETDAALEAAGKKYYDFRAYLMVRNNEGLTKAYNRFHDPAEPSPEIARLRELHAAMDRVVLDAYGWPDVPTACGFALDWLDLDDDELANTLAEAPDDIRERIETANYFFADAAAACRFQSHIKKEGRGKLPWRHRWPDEVRDDVLARLLALNAARAKAERLAGLAAPTRRDEDDDSGDDGADSGPDGDADSSGPDHGGGNQSNGDDPSRRSPRGPRPGNTAKKASKRAAKRSAPRPLLPDDGE